MRYRKIALYCLSPNNIVLTPQASIISGARYYGVSVPEFMDNVARNGFTGYNGHPRYLSQWGFDSGTLFHDLFEHHRNAIIASTYEDEISALGSALYLRTREEGDPKEFFWGAISLLQEILRKHGLPRISNNSPATSNVIKKTDQIFGLIPDVSEVIGFWKRPFTDSFEDEDGNDLAEAYSPEELSLIYDFFRFHFGKGVIRAHRKFPDYSAAQEFYYHWAERLNCYLRSHNYSHVFSMSDTFDIHQVEFLPLERCTTVDRMLKVL